jgi:hypothetical protein
MGECMLKLAVEDLAFLIKPLNHREGFMFWGGGSEPSGERVRFEGCIPNGGGEVIILGRGRFK